MHALAGATSFMNLSVQKQPPRGIPWKKCSENMQQIYRKTPMAKCDFDKSHFGMGVLL